MRGKLTYANVMVTILAVIVLGGGVTYAAQQLKKNSVGTKQLKDGAVTAPKLANGAIQGNAVSGDVPRADDADRLGGSPPSSFLSATGKAADADNLDGSDSSDFGAVTTGRSSGFSGAAPSGFGAIEGLSTAGLLERDVTTLTPATPLQARDISVKLLDSANGPVNPGGGRIVSVLLLIDGNPTPLCTVPSASNACTQATGPAIPASSRIAYLINGGGAGVFPDFDVAVGMRLTNP